MKLKNPKNTKNRYFLMSVASLYTPCFVMLCVFLYGPFCHGAHKLDLSTLFTTFYLWTSLPFILIESYLLPKSFANMWYIIWSLRLVLLVQWSLRLVVLVRPSTKSPLLTMIWRKSVRSILICSDLTYQNDVHTGDSNIRKNY